MFVRRSPPLSTRSAIGSTRWTTSWRSWDRMSEESAALRRTARGRRMSEMSPGAGLADRAAALSRRIQDHIRLSALAEQLDGFQTQQNAVTSMADDLARSVRLYEALRTRGVYLASPVSEIE